MIFRELMVDDEKTVLSAYQEILMSEHDFGYDKFSGAYYLKKLEDLDYLNFLSLLNSMNSDKMFRQTVYGLFNDEDKVVGFAIIRWYDTYETLNYQGHVGAIIVPSSRGNKYAQIILNEAVKILFSCGKEKIIVSSKINNKSSYKTIESCGFSFVKYFEDDKKEKYKVYKLEKKYS